MLRLSLLAFRRVLPAWLAAVLLVLLVLAARASSSSPLFEADATGLAGVRALARQNVWSVLLAVVPLLLVRAARLGTPAELRWVAPAPVAPASLALALAGGAALACLVATLLTAAVCEATLAGAPEAWSRALTLALPSTTLLDEAPEQTWSVPAPPPGERLRLWTTIAIGSGPAVTARLTVRAGAEERTCEARVAGRTALELVPPPVPEGGDLAVELRRVGPGALLVVPTDALEVLGPVASERLGSWRLALRVFAALAAGSALALGLTRHLRPSLAGGLVLALALASWSSPLAARWIPGADLPGAWRALAEGLVPPAMPGEAVACTLALAAAGLALHARRARAGGGIA